MPHHSHAPPPEPQPGTSSPSSQPSATLGYSLFATRWLQAPLYFGLVAAQGVYVYKFFRELWTLIIRSVTGQANETYVMLAVLKLVDVVMIANLLIMVIVGGYETFVSRIGLQGHRDQPEWLSHVNSNVLKVKLATAIVGISSVHLLQMFVDVHHTSHHSLLWGTVIHMAFIASAAILAYMSGPMAAHGERLHKGHGLGHGLGQGHGLGLGLGHVQVSGPRPGAEGPGRAMEAMTGYESSASAGLSAPSASSAAPGPFAYPSSSASPAPSTSSVPAEFAFAIKTAPATRVTVPVAGPSTAQATAPIPAQALSSSYDTHHPYDSHHAYDPHDPCDVYDSTEPGAEARIRDARFPARKLLEDFDEEYPRVLDREAVARLGTLDFVATRRNVVFVGPPGTGKTHLAVGLGVRACQSGHQVLFATAAQWAARLAGARSAGRLTEELADLDARPLLIVDEVGYTPLDQDTAHLFFQLVAHRYERSSLIVTTDRPLGRWEEVFGGAAPAMVDRLAHHAEIVRLEGDSYRMRRVTSAWAE
ncbi:IS21-like element helper ATPase IstB [Streptomyces sp. NBC_00414]|uniref:IS21-like element helper ATPase IstB n=1 Tax=Streptomyces sp. NBC_00414 TaxID=2975739 RepID=UPI002E212339